jgi:hypothetical protein
VFVIHDFEYEHVLGVVYRDVEDLVPFAAADIASVSGDEGGMETYGSRLLLITRERVTTMPLCMTRR